MWLRLLIVSVMAVIWLSFVASYVRELWVLLTKRGDYDALEKPVFRGGEDGPGDPEITSATGRLAFAYPFFIIVIGMGTIGLGRRVLSELFG